MNMVLNLQVLNVQGISYCRTQIPTFIPLTVLVWIYLISVNFKRQHNPQYLCWYELLFKSISFFSEFVLLT